MFLMWLGMWLMVSLEIDGDLNRLNTETIGVHFGCLKQAVKLMNGGD